MIQNNGRDLAQKSLDAEQEALFEALENEESNDREMNRIKEMRIQQLKFQMEELKAFKTQGTGELAEAKNEKEVLEITTTVECCIVHFYHKDFRRCSIMDDHLKKLAQRHYKTKFVKVNVENAPLLVTRLQIQILPCVISFINGVSVDRIVGFEELGSVDNFETVALERRLINCGVIERIKTGNTAVVRKSINSRNHDSDSD